MSARYRAFFVIGAICAVAFGLVAPGVNAAASPLSAQATIDCPHHFATSVSSASHHLSQPPHTPRHAGFGHCPDCCLAAHAGAAVLPLRSASFARPERRVASGMRYAPYRSSALTLIAAVAANGARAPPAA